MEYYFHKSNMITTLQNGNDQAQDSDARIIISCETTLDQLPIVSLISIVGTQFLFCTTGTIMIYKKFGFWILKG